VALAKPATNSLKRLSASRSDLILFKALLSLSYIPVNPVITPATVPCTVRSTLASSVR
jgi:hypothetical protein